MEISDLLAFTVKNKASDLHLSAGLPPMIRVHGDIRRINLPPLAHHSQLILGVVPGCPTVFNRQAGYP